LAAFKRANERVARLQETERTRSLYILAGDRTRNTDRSIVAVGVTTDMRRTEVECRLKFAPSAFLRAISGAQ
jgi:hypothetical protein